MPEPMGFEVGWKHLTEFLNDQIRAIYNGTTHRLRGCRNAFVALVQVVEALPEGHPLKEKALKSALLHGCLFESEYPLSPKEREWVRDTVKAMRAKLPPPPKPKEHPSPKFDLEFEAKLEQEGLSYDGAHALLRKQWEGNLREKWKEWAKGRYGSTRFEDIKDGIVSKLTDTLISDKEFVDAFVNSPFNYIFATADDALKDKETLRKHVYEVVDGLVGVWAQTASDEHPLSWALQIAIAQEFGLTENYELLQKMLQRLDESKEAPNIVAKTAFLYETLKPILHKYVRAVYNETQEFLKESGLEELWLVRGVALPHELAEPLPEWDFKLFDALFLPASSWTLIPETAEEFATMQSERTVGTEPVTYLIRIPKEAFPLILSIALTGWGCYDEKEFVLMLRGKQQVAANSLREYDDFGYVD
jgi:hypothetical protein